MNKEDCLFCGIAKGEIEAEIILEDERFLAFKDKFPKAPTHVLVIPRKHIDWFNDIGGVEDGFCRDMLAFIVKTADKLGVKESGYRVINNVGSGGGQLIFHLHWHILAGKSVGFNLEDNL